MDIGFQGHHQTRQQHVLRLKKQSGTAQPAKRAGKWLRHGA
jgi:hypothetical protein